MGTAQVPGPSAQDVPAPLHYKQATHSHDWPLWQMAIDTELEQLDVRNPPRATCGSAKTIRPSLRAAATCYCTWTGPRTSAASRPASTTAGVGAVREHVPPGHHPDAADRLPQALDCALAQAPGAPDDCDTPHLAHQRGRPEATLQDGRIRHGQLASNHRDGYHRREHCALERSPARHP
jgi:hypothetical protein